MTITGTTRLYAILGDPLSKARTPERFNALFAQRGVDAVMVPAEVDAAGFDAAVAGFKRLRNCDGLIVTMPHKQAMLRHVDELHENGKRSERSTRRGAFPTGAGLETCSMGAATSARCARTASSSRASGCT
jgi:hypothetical protein